MNLETHISMLQQQNRLLKSIFCLVAILVAIALCMGAASFNQDRGELLQITKIQLIDEKGNEVAIIDSKGINFTGKDSQVVANKIVGRRSVAANANPDGDKRYAELGVTSDRTCYTELANGGAVYHHILSGAGVLESNY
jgi:hypothetical protein